MLKLETVMTTYLSLKDIKNKKVDHRTSLQETNVLPFLSAVSNCGLVAASSVEREDLLHHVCFFNSSLTTNSNVNKGNNNDDDGV